MTWKFNPFTGELDYYLKTFWGVLSSAPSTTVEGSTYINSGNHGYYIYYGGTWQLLHTLTPAVQETVTFEGEGVTYEGEDLTFGG